MTNTSTEQPEALRLAELLDNGEWCNYDDRSAAAAELRRLHARVQELEAENARLIETYVPKSPRTHMYEPVVSLGYDKAGNGTFTAVMTVSGLESEAKASAALNHMERLFCGSEIPKEQFQ